MSVFTSEMERQRNETTSQARRGEYGEDVKKTFGIKVGESNYYTYSEYIDMLTSQN